MNDEVYDNQLLRITL